MKNYYEILEVNKKASKEVIEKAYRVLIKKYHPDLYEGEKRKYAEEKTRDINEAYRVLSDAFLKEQYDIELEKENQYNRLYKSTSATQNIENSNRMAREKQKDIIDDEEPKKTHKVGSIMALVDLIGEAYKNRPKTNEKKELKREDMIAAGLTLIIVVILGIVLWFVPATHGFIRSLIPF